MKTKLILPFAVTATNRNRAFTKEVEMAAILYLAESDRVKGEGILRRADEKMAFITEACYPIWLVPWGGRTLLFDGLGLTTHRLSYDKLPDLEAFNKDIRRNAKTSKAYSVALSRNTNYFKGFSGKEENTIDGLIASPSFMRDFSAYLLEVQTWEKPLAAKAVLSPIMDESDVWDSIEKVTDLRSRFDENVKNADKSVKMLNKTTRVKAKAIRREIKGLRKKYGRQTKRVKGNAKKKIRRIRRQYNGRIVRISRQFGRQLQLLREERARLKKRRTFQIAEMHHCEARIKSCRRRKNKRNESQWARKLKKIRKGFPTLEARIKGVDRRIVKTRAAKKLDTSQQRMERDARIEEAGRSLRDVQASRIASIRVKRREMNSLKNTTSLIVNQMSKMVKSKRSALHEFDRISVPIRKRACTLVYLPFYLVRYEMDSKKRYAVYPPSVVGNMGILTRMKGAVGAARMRAFLRPRSRAITEFLNQLVPLIHKNPRLEREITDAGIQESILRGKKLRLGVKRGLKELKDEKWMSKNELQAFSKVLYIYA